MPKVTYEPISAKDALKQIKDLCSIMVDLAFSSIIYEDKGLAEEVKELRDLAVKLNYLLTMSLQVAVRDGRDAQATIPLVVLGHASVDIANSATDISNVLLKGFNVHQIIKDLSQRVARDLMRGKISEESILKGYAIKDITEKMNYSVTIYGLRQDEKWIIKPDQSIKLEADDLILASGSSSGISLLKLLVGGTAEEISPPEEEDEDPSVESLADNIVDYLIALKDTSEVMVDLAYGAVLYNNKELAQLVTNMEKRVDTIRNKAEIAVLRLTRNTSEDISALQGLVRIIEATEDISDSANQIAKTVLAELPSHPIIELVVEESTENIFEMIVEESSSIVDKTVPAGNYLDEFGIRVLAIKRTAGHYFKPRRRTKIRVGDTIIFTGLRDACNAFQQREEEAVEEKEAEIEAAKKAAELVVDEVVEKVSEEVSEITAKEVSKKTVKEVASKAAEKATEKASKKAASEAAEEAVDTVTKKMTDKIVSEVVKETMKTKKGDKSGPKKEATKKVVQDAAENAAKKTVEDARKKVEQAVKEAAEDTIEEKSETVIKKVTKAAEKKAAEEIEPVVKDAVKIETERAAKKAATEAIKETSTIDEPEKIVIDAATEAAKEVAEKSAERVVERAGKRVATKAAEEAAEKAAEKETKKVAKKAAKEAAEEVAEEVLEKEVKEAVQKAAEEAAKKATKEEK
ncbi:MAG: hypothetical protein KAX09_06695 [Candidatus Heimdallarchaeota archaeon]|nr:hypothetical protein [Candidatus Heimdallarchaeota archaeon]MCK4290655.1 hypothetical protein [Candidatus Heimdallarchaeota archaeon]